MFGEVKGKDQLLTATNVWALSQSMKKKVDLEAERYLRSDGYVVKIDTALVLP